ncbi:MAG: hypothetical protein Ct9H300mP25_05590 [Acidobacteriota bacterium]|nr:MAG: hypothetical protein Ct9H300mP25_05590 [Acidobacteriota bacterium]
MHVRLQALLAIAALFMVSSLSFAQSSEPSRSTPWGDLISEGYGITGPLHHWNVLTNLVKGHTHRRRGCHVCSRSNAEALARDLAAPPGDQVLIAKLSGPTGSRDSINASITHC